MGADEQRPMKEPYCLLNAGWKDDGETKWYSRWQEVVDILHERHPDLKVVQVGETHHHHPRLKNVVNMIGAWNGKGRLPIVWAYHSLFGMGPISFLMHVYAGHSKPYVCVATGYEPPTWACNYLGHRFVTRFGSLPCCRFNGCGKRHWRGCTNMKGERLPACLDIPAIDTEQEKRASCERLERAKRFAVSFNGLLGDAFLKLFPSMSGSRLLFVSLAKPFSSCFLRCLVHVSLSSPSPRLSQAVSFAV